MWYGKFVVIHISFRWSSSEIKSINDCIEASRHILYNEFTEYLYLVPYLDDGKAKSFCNWIDNSKERTKEDIFDGIEELVRSMLIRHNYEKRYLLLIDEFDRLCASALFEFDKNTINHFIVLGSLPNIQRFVMAYLPVLFHLPIYCMYVVFLE